MNPFHLKKTISYTITKSRNWLAAIIAMFVILLSGIYFYRATPSHNVRITVLLDQDINTKNLKTLEKGTDFTFGKSLYPSRKEYFNQIGILQSHTLLQRTFSKLNFETPVYKYKFTGFHEVYDNPPIKICYNSDHCQPLGINFKITVLENNRLKIKARGTTKGTYNYSLKKRSESTQQINLDTTITSGGLLAYPWGCFRVNINDKFGDFCTGQRYKFNFVSYDELIETYRSRTIFSPVSKGSSLLDIGFKTKTPIKDCLFLNTLLETYAEMKLDLKNDNAFEFLAFIHSEKEIWKDSLSRSGDRFYKLQKQTDTYGSEIQTKGIINTIHKLENQLLHIKLKTQQCHLIKEEINQNLDSIKIIAPSLINLEDIHLKKSIIALNNLNLKFLKQRENLSKHTCATKSLAAHIYHQKQSILKKTETLITKCIFESDEIQKRILQQNELLIPLLDKESRLLWSEYHFLINKKNLSYLQMKEIEAKTNKALISDIPIIIDPAMIKDEKTQEFNNYKKNLTIVGGGVIAALIFLFFSKTLDTFKIQGFNEIKEITPLPIVGEIKRSKHKTQTVVFDYPQSKISNNFRSIRENILLNNPQALKKVILITSSDSGEGKTFSSINLSSCFALLGKPTILIGFDLHRPKISEVFDISNNTGITTFLAGNCKLVEIIKPTGYLNLDFIPAGPNPTDLIGEINAQKVKELLETLRRKYDHIIIDTAPVGLVSDTLILSKFADLNIILTRSNFTSKEKLKRVTSMLNDHYIQNVYLALNDA